MAGLKKLPKILWIQSAVLASIAIMFPIQIALTYNLEVWNFALTFEKLSSLNIMVMGISLLNAVLVLRLVPLLKITLPAQLLLVTWNNIIVGSAAINYTAWEAVLSTMVFVAFSSSFLKEPIRGILLNPDRRWWLRPQRSNMSLELSLHSPLGLVFRAKTFDLSATGAFVSLPDIMLPDLSAAIAPGSHLDLRVKLNQVQVLVLRAKVVRWSLKKGTYPSGLGVEFVYLTAYQKQILNDLLSQKIPVIEAA